MASQWYVLENDYKVEQQVITRPIYDSNKARMGIYPYFNDADISDLKDVYYEQIDDLNYGYRIEAGNAPRINVAIKPTKTNVPVIEVGIYYSVDQLARINRSKIPASERLQAASRAIALAEQQIAFTGATAAAHGTVVASVSGTGTQSTAASTEYNISTWALMQSTLAGMIGQLIDGLNEINHPLAFVMTPDVYKVLIGLENANTDYNALDWTRAYLKSFHPNSEVFYTQYLAGTYASRAAGAKKQSFTAGTTNACLYCVNPEWYGIQTSPIVARSEFSPREGLKVDLLERFVPIYKKKAAIIYSGNAVID